MPVATGLVSPVYFVVDRRVPVEQLLQRVRPARLRLRGHAHSAHRSLRLFTHLLCFGDFGLHCALSGNKGLSKESRFWIIVYGILNSHLFVVNNIKA